MKAEKLAPLPATLPDETVGISHFAFSQNLLAGGVNFPRFEVFKKQYYSAVYFRGENDAFCEVGALPKPLAYAAFCSTADALFVIGGMTEENGAGATLSSFYRLSYDKGKLEIEQLYAFPHRVHSAAACYFEGAIYVAGGVQDDKESGACFKYDFSSQAWQEIAALPGLPRQQAILVACDVPLLFSGFATGEHAQVFTDVLALRDGKWETFDRFPLSVAGGSAVLSGGRIYFVGGVNQLVFTTALRREFYSANAPEATEWLKQFGSKYIWQDRAFYDFNQFLCVYDVQKKLFQTQHVGTDLGRAGCGLMLSGKRLIVIDGETQPRKRVREILALPIE